VNSGSCTYNHDAKGQRASMICPDGTTAYGYDLLGNLLRVSKPNGQVIEYVVDAQGRRIGRKENGILTQSFLYDGQLTPVAELDASGQVVSRFVYGSRANAPDYMIKNGVNYRLVSDERGSIRLVVNAATGAVVSSLEYDVWGNVTGSVNASFQPFGFAGGLRDDATGLVRFGARDYDPKLGRWTAKDPIRFNGGLTNLYGYVGNDPVNLVDPSGRFAWMVWGGVAGFTTGVISSRMGGNSWGASFLNGVVNGAIGAATGGLFSTGIKLGSGVVLGAGIGALGDVSSQSVSQMDAEIHGRCYQWSGAEIFGAAIGGGFSGAFGSLVANEAAVLSAGTQDFLSSGFSISTFFGSMIGDISDGPSKGSY